MTRRLGLIVFPDFQILDATGPTAAFKMPMRDLEPSPYSLDFLSRAGGPVRSSSGGFGDTDRMRSAFLRAFGQPPQALRRGAARTRAAVSAE